MALVAGGLEARGAKAKEPAGRLVRADRSPLGVTLTLALDHAPFPCAGAPYDDRTVLVFVPKHFRPARNGRIDALVHFHGHNSTVLPAIETHELREQLAESRQNAILIAPQGPVRAADSNGGKLEQPGGLQRMLDEVMREIARPSVRRALGPSAIVGSPRIGHLCLSAHSGGYKVVAACLENGGVEVSEVYLFDALYGSVPAFRSWMGRGGKRGPRRKLVSTYATPPVRTNNLTLMNDLLADGVDVLHEQKPGELSRKQLIRGRAIFIASPLDHGGVTHRHNNLRDCLYASGLKRNQKTDWFDRKNGARPIDERN